MRAKRTAMSSCVLRRQIAPIAMIGYFLRRFQRRRSTMPASENNNVPGLPCGCCPPRRGFLGTLAALGAAALLPGELMAQGAKKAPRRPHRIDVHHHLMYPGYLDEAGGRRAGSTFKWPPEMSLEDMAQTAIAVSALSLLHPTSVPPNLEKSR